AVSRIIRSGEDPYFAAQSRVVNFHSAELEAVAKVIVPDSALNGAPLSEAEVRALRIANDKARTGKTREGAGAELADVQRRSKKMPTAGPSPQSEDEPRSTWTYPKGTWRPAPDLRQHDRAEIPAFLKREAPEGGWKKG